MSRFGVRISVTVPAETFLADRYDVTAKSQQVLIARNRCDIRVDCPRIRSARRIIDAHILQLYVVVFLLLGKIGLDFVEELPVIVLCRVFAQHEDKIRHCCRVRNRLDDLREVNDCDRYQLPIAAAVRKPVAMILRKLIATA